MLSKEALQCTYTAEIILKASYVPNVDGTDNPANITSNTAKKIFEEFVLFVLAGENNQPIPPGKGLFLKKYLYFVSRLSLLRYTGQNNQHEESMVFF